VGRFEVGSDGVAIAGNSAGEGPPIVLLHGLTATRRYVVMGSHLLERRGYRLVGYDARGHGESSPAPEPGAYDYVDLVRDLEAVLDDLRIERAVLAGSSMGAATAVAFTLKAPDRVAALVQSTPAYSGRPHDDPEERRAWEAMADGLEREGVDGFLEAYDPGVGARWVDSVRRLTRQRLERHRDLGALADAMRVVPRSQAFDGLGQLARIDVPALVVGSRDEADPEHPLALAHEYVERITDAELAVEKPGKPPLAWRGAQLSRTIAEFLARRARDLASDAGV
jgi:pimeloyl-ACP methyl ester carboxylesterase